jgi:hypothetical protein
MESKALEFDFDTKEGRDEAKKQIIELFNSDDKVKQGEYIYALTEFIVKHEVNFANIKNSIEI